MFGYDVEMGIIKSFGGSHITSYSLINNYGYKFKIGDKDCSIRHWLNCYGCDVDYWESDKLDTDEIVKEICKTLKEFSWGEMDEISIKEFQRIGRND